MFKNVTAVCVGPGGEGTSSPALGEGPDSGSTTAGLPLPSVTSTTLVQTSKPEYFSNLSPASLVSNSTSFYSYFPFPLPMVWAKKYPPCSSLLMQPSQPLLTSFPQASVTSPECSLPSLTSCGTKDTTPPLTTDRLQG